MLRSYYGRTNDLLRVDEYQSFDREEDYRDFEDMREEINRELIDLRNSRFENYFPKHLEYELDEFGIPIRVNCDEEKEDWFYEGVKVRKDLEKEGENKLMEMLKERHHLPKKKRISERYNTHII